jgi:hypothetical protein
MRAWLAAAYRPIRFMAAQYSWPSALSRESRARARQFLRKLAVLGCGELAVMVADSRPGSTVSAVGEERHVFAGFKPACVVGHGEEAKFHEVVSAPACPELCPAAFLVFRGDRTHRPVFVEDIHRETGGL